VRLFAAAEILRLTGASRNPLGIEQPLYEHSQAAARTRLGEKAFAALWAEGRAMTPEEALAAEEHIESDQQLTASAPGKLTPAPSAPSPGLLTARQEQVLRLLAVGLTYQQIAERLVISRRTVNVHVGAIFKRLQVASRTAATRYAIEHGLG
jgi:DNA-binding NarL/FixJ family response regulator